MNLQNSSLPNYRVTFYYYLGSRGYLQLFLYVKYCKMLCFSSVFPRKRPQGEYLHRYKRRFCFVFTLPSQRKVHTVHGILRSAHGLHIIPELPWGGCTPSEIAEKD